MVRMNFVKVGDEKLAGIVCETAFRIWREYYAPIIGCEQVEYMLEKFQSKEAILSQIENEGYQYYLLEDDKSNRVGYIAVVPKEEELFLSKLYVTVEYRGKGYGRAAVDFIGNLAVAGGFRRIGLTVNKHNVNSIKTYEKLGFVNAGARITDIGNGYVMDDFKMEKVLK